MTAILSAFAKSIAQLRDPAILRVLVKTIAITLAIFAMIAVAAWYGLSAVLTDNGLAFGSELGAILAVVLTIAGGWLLFRIVALMVVQFFADEIVEAVERRHYPTALRNARPIGFRDEIGGSFRSALRAVLVNALAALLAIPLLVTAIGPALVFGVANAWLLGRELQDMVWLRHRTSAGDTPPLGQVQRFALGAGVTLLLAIPFANLLAAVLGTASATHLVHGRLARNGKTV